MYVCIWKKTTNFRVLSRGFLNKNQSKKKTNKRCENEWVGKKRKTKKVKIYWRLLSLRMQWTWYENSVKPDR